MSEEFLRRLRRTHEQAQKTRQAIESVGGINGRRIPNASVLRADDAEIYTALQKLAQPLAASYAQVKLDLQEPGRESYTGTAHEIREVLANTLRILAPDGEVTIQKWYRKEQDSSGPTQKQRVKYILQKSGAGSKESEVVEQVSRLDEMIGDIVRATYSRASDAAHRFKPKKEVARIVKYFDVFARDLLNID